MVCAFLLPKQWRLFRGRAVRKYRKTVVLMYVSVALPVLLAHCGMIAVPAMAMSIIGGLLIYGTIISFTMFFHEEQDF